MLLNDENLEYAFSGTIFTNLSEDDGVIYKFRNLTITFKGIRKEAEAVGTNKLVMTIEISNKRSTEMWLCYSLLLKDSKEIFDDFLPIEPNHDQEIDIWLEDYDIAHSDNRTAYVELFLEDGRRRILGKCSSICVQYNIFSGRYKYKRVGEDFRGNPRKSREIDIRVHKLKERRYFADDWSYMYFGDTIPVEISNFSESDMKIMINNLELDGKIPAEIIGVNAFTDVIDIPRWDTCSLDIVIPSNCHISDGAKLDINFTDIWTNYRYVNAYSYDDDSQLCKIDFSFIFPHKEIELMKGEIR